LEVDVGGQSIDSFDPLLESGELGEGGLESLNLVSGFKVNGVLAQLTDVVAFSKEVVDFSSSGSSG